MNTAWDKERLQVFVKNTLGCGCPDKVFKKIDVGKCLVDGINKKITRIVVGDTLLIYIIDYESALKISDHVEIIGLAGKTDRDKNHYNRFRMVVTALEDYSQQASVSDIFLKAFNTDEKMHIHFINKKLVEGLWSVTG